KPGLKLVLISLIITVSLSMLQINYVCTLVRRNAHKNRSKFYTFLTHNRLLLRRHMKIQAFIEHLSGRDIGFYCYDLFPMNNYEFFTYVCNGLMFYFLLRTIITISVT